MGRVSQIFRLSRFGRSKTIRSLECSPRTCSSSCLIEHRFARMTDVYSYRVIRKFRDIYHYLLKINKYLLFLIHRIKNAKRLSHLYLPTLWPHIKRELWSQDVLPQYFMHRRYRLEERAGNI